VFAVGSMVGTIAACRPEHSMFRRASTPHET
jgi:hypothetical protein